MLDPARLTRSSLEVVFSSRELLSVPEEGLARVAHEGAREALRTFGMPAFSNPVIGGELSVAEGFVTLADALDWQLSDSYEEIPEGADSWFLIGDNGGYDLMALAPDTGEVYCLPQEGEIYRLHAELRSYIHFLYLMRLEQPNYDPEWGGIDGPDWEQDHEGAHSRTLAAMQAVDPEALQNPDSFWNTSVLPIILDPASEYY